jgi:hypothetical protein
MAIGDGGQPQGPNFANLALQNQLAQQSSSNAPPASSMDDLVTSLFGLCGGIFTFCKVKADSLFNTGILAHIQMQQGASEKPMNQAAQSLSMRGGRLAQMLAQFKPEFSKIIAPQIAASMHDVSFASLGTLSPPSFGGGGRGMELG